MRLVPPESSEVADHGLSKKLIETELLHKRFFRCLIPVNRVATRKAAPRRPDESRMGYPTAARLWTYRRALGLAGVVAGGWPPPPARGRVTRPLGGPLSYREGGPPKLVSQTVTGLGVRRGRAGSRRTSGAVVACEPYASRARKTP
ncbi:hypothetical protein Ari01nite_25480 [Paractinoplanes rishiriensis]|uniref:Uncharacterized protein n=1 Tax=Paractinoplanes rishiriensis TaxID=1050105 RepID=A0A919JUM3_9ACTN|nr:hypothetical protein Ari01nite_25480 [Actinoplanes rishiriensis]